LNLLKRKSNARIFLKIFRGGANVGAGGFKKQKWRGEIPRLLYA